MENRYRKGLEAAARVPSANLPPPRNVLADKAKSPSKLRKNILASAADPILAMASEPVRIAINPFELGRKRRRP